MKQALLFLLPASRWFLAWLPLQHWRWRRTCSSETSVDFERITRHYISEDGTLNLKYDHILCYFTKNWIGTEPLLFCLKPDKKCPQVSP
jgi:hypothetical protein